MLQGFWVNFGLLIRIRILIREAKLYGSGSFAIVYIDKVDESNIKNTFNGILGSTLREAAKKTVLFLVVRPLRGGGVRARPVRKKELFYDEKKALVVGPLKKEVFFCGFPYRVTSSNHGRVFLVPCKKCLVQCTLLPTYTLDKSLISRYQKHGHVKLNTLYI